MKRILQSKRGVTVLEGLIALGLLAIVAGGTFGVLLSVSRQAGQPDIQEEMILAVERANEQLQMYRMDAEPSSLVPDYFKKGLCGGDDYPLSEGEHRINCMLPPICDTNTSNFEYKVESVSQALPANPISGAAARTNMKITFDIECNGFTL